MQSKQSLIREQKYYLADLSIYYATKTIIVRGLLLKPLFKTINNKHF